MSLTVDDALAQLTPRPGLIVLMCGLAGSGKTTFAQALEAKGFERLSIDEEVWRRSGKYGVDYAPDDYPARLADGRAALRERLLEQLRARRPAVVDSAFWSRAHRDAYKADIEAAGGAWRLVYLKASPELLRARLAVRAARFDADAAFPIDEATLTRFLASFEPPQGEGEITVEV